MKISAEQIKALRQKTGAGVLNCQKALEEAQGDLEAAAKILREKGMVKAAGRSGREARDGVVDLYSHGEGRLGVMIEVSTETDFVARTPEFRKFAHEMALQVAATSPRWVSPDDVPEEILEQQRSASREAALAEGKPENVVERIVEGKLEKFLSEVCLMNQPYVRDEDRKVSEVMQDLILATGENVSIRRFERWELGEAQD
ncbi:MAG: translation elongation factor Ts [Chloroflexi bacterium]|nr:translation elongation factor Ts [Chloroflexota bacterium]MCI0773256.1 translation elongation factor Ts [Chloroflexota bacterium]MCI0806732.1 translation elongation factor Ts [Chloroflexota bacterium]MCI0827772.1 translation elongation factor Ts [Chloroflexota bacterium]MCI0854235.1 translation elongation factor Ts [Chloroflexota bacterium]